MKREILLSLSILFCVNGFAQNIKIEEQRIKESDEKVFVTFTLVADKIKSNERLTLTPVLYSGDKNKNLKSITITGRNRAIADKRQLAPDGMRTTNNQRIPYSITVPYESWMSCISLRVDRKVESCCTEQVLASLVVFQNRAIRYDVILPPLEFIKQELSPIEKMDIELPFLAPMSEYAAFKKNINMMRTEGALIVRFKQGNTVIDPALGENAASLEQVRKVLEQIEAAPNASTGKILLAGTASPEGTNKQNDQLAQKRVQALLNYLKESTCADINLVENINLGEDWIGLRKMVDESNMQYKKEVLEIIDNVAVSDGRNKRLMDLKWGRPYNYMLEHFFPKLRSAGYIRIFYESTSSEEFKKTNQAIELCNNEEYRNAIAKLEDVDPTASTEHIRGVCYMMLGEYDKAQLALNKAVELGNPLSTDQLKQLEKLKAIER